jgi:putative transposase
VRKQSTTKPLAVDYFKVPRRLWRIMKKHLPAEAQPSQAGGRPRIGNRAVLNGIWYLLWTGAQWKAVKRDWFGVSSSVLHERFQTWQEQGIWDQVFQALVKFYRRERRIRWTWQAVDSRACAAPLGGTATGKNPTDRAKLGAKIHILVDQRGAPLAIEISGANQHDKWSVASLVVHIAVRRPGFEQHFLADKGYDYADVHETVERAGYIKHIKHRRRRGEPKQTPALCRVRPSIPHGAGSLSAPSLGWSNAAAFGPAGARRPAIGSPWSGSPAPASCATWRFSDRFLARLCPFDTRLEETGRIN